MFHNISSLLKRAIKKTCNQGEREAYFRKMIQLKELRRIGKFPRYTKLETAILGPKFTVPDSASFIFMFKEIFFEHIYRFNTVIDKPYIIDCGANIGLSVIYFKKLYPDARVIAFEPDDQIFNVLNNNISSFNFNNVQLINKGLWNKEGYLSFKKEGADAGQINFKNEASNYSIEVTKLSSYLKQKVDFLKIDIEGAEVTVLEECKAELINVRYIFVEYHSFMKEEQHLEQVFSILKNSGFRTYVDSPGLSSKNPFMQINTYNGMDMQLNIFGIRK